MIKYRLICNDCNLSFDSWFGSSKEYEKLKQKNFLICHNCNSTKIEKTLMSPQLIKKAQGKYKDKTDVKLREITEKIKILISTMKFLPERKVLLFIQWILQKNTLILMQITEANSIENFTIIINSIS